MVNKTYADLVVSIQTPRYFGTKAFLVQCGLYRVDEGHYTNGTGFAEFGINPGVVTHVVEEAKEEKIELNLNPSLENRQKLTIEKRFEQAKTAGLTIAHELADQPWGDRAFAVEGPLGIPMWFNEPLQNS